MGMSGFSDVPLYLTNYSIKFSRFACQQRVLKTFPGPDVRFGNGEVGS